MTLLWVVASGGRSFGVAADRNRRSPSPVISRGWRRAFSLEKFTLMDGTRRRPSWLMARPRGCPVSPVLKRDATSTVLESPFTLAQGGGLFSVTLYFHWVMTVARRRPQALSTPRHAGLQRIAPICCCGATVSSARPYYKGRARKARIFSSSDVALLGRVFDKLKDDDQSLGVREALASRLLKLPLGR
jgi:hypothetical protein